LAQHHAGVSPREWGVAPRDGSKLAPFTTSNLRWPKYLTPILLPSRWSELNSVQQVWQFLRANFLSNHVFENYDDIIAAACHACCSLIALPQIITSIGSPDRAHVGQP
jgi:hypothetical protein